MLQKRALDNFLAKLSFLGMADVVHTMDELSSKNELSEVELKL